MAFQICGPSKEVCATAGRIPALFNLMVGVWGGVLPSNWESSTSPCHPVKIINLQTRCRKWMKQESWLVVEPQSLTMNDRQCQQPCVCEKVV